MSDTAVVSVKVPPHLLDEVRRSKEEIDWPEELRRFIQERLKRWKADRLLDSIHAEHVRRPSRPRGFSSGLVREDRDRH